MRRRAVKTGGMKTRTSSRKGEGEGWREEERALRGINGLHNSILLKFLDFNIGVIDLLAVRHGCSHLSAHLNNLRLQKTSSHQISPLRRV